MPNKEPPPCINLRERFGKKYRVVLEEPAVTYADPWYHIIQCQFGHIYVHGHDMLGYACSTPSRSRKVAAIPGVIETQRGDDGSNLIFHVDLLPQIAKIAKPYRRRTLSVEQKAACIERLAKYRENLNVESVS